VSVFVFRFVHGPPESPAGIGRVQDCYGVAELLRHVRAFAASLDEDACERSPQIVKPELALLIRVQLRLVGCFENDLPRLRKWSGRRDSVQKT